MKNIFLLHIIILFPIAEVFAQVQTDSLAADSLHITMADTVETEVLDIKKPFITVPWQKEAPLATSTVTTDSLLRWQIWPGWGDFQANRNDVISFRQGTTGSLDAFHIKGYLPDEQEIKMDGIKLNNPVTGLANYNLLPHRKIAVASEELTGNYRSHIRLRDYYLVQPISYLNYDESANAYRNLEFMISQNFTGRTNLELSYWDRRDGNYYPNNEVKGSQIFGRVYHHLSQKFLLRALYMNNSFERNEPFGYVVEDPRFFNFDQFTSPPVSSNGASEFTRWDLISGIYHRKDSSSIEDAGLEISISKNQQDVVFSEDTLDWVIRTLNGRLFKKMDVNALRLNAEVEAAHHQSTGFTSLNIENWSNFNANLDAGLDVGNILFYGKGALSYRSDDESGFETGIGIKGTLAERFNFEANAFLFSRIPSIQSKYWNSENYYGNPTLRNEIGYAYTATGDLRIFDRFTLGATWRYKNAKRQVMLHSDSTFFNSNLFEQFSASVFGRFESSLLELESSATAQLFEYCCENSNRMLNEMDPVLWFRNSAFIKGYVFERAAYLKIGIKTLFSPLYYESRAFNTQLQFWQGNSSYQALPPFFRLDAELSARVRAIMVVLRWENALDGMGQAGYFETAGYPMPPRRLIVGIRAQFRN